MMHPNVKKGRQEHKAHFDAIRNNGWSAPGWEVWKVDQAIGSTRLRPDWVLRNQSRKLIIVVDLTTKYRPTHYKKGTRYVEAIRRDIEDPTWEVVYLEDYWLNATIH